MMTANIESEVMSIIRRYEAGRRLLPDAVAEICELVTKQNVEQISALLSGELYEQFIDYAKACHDEVSWYHIGGGNAGKDPIRGCPFPDECCAALSDWYSSRIKN